MTTIQRAPIVPERVRSTAGQGFAFLPHRFLILPQQMQASFHLQLGSRSTS